MEGKGLIHIYTGEGKGKTTAALGLAIRAAGHGLRVSIVQFMKSECFKTGEIKLLDSIPNIDLYCFAGNLIDDPELTPEKITSQNSGLKKAEEIMMNRSADMIILDELNTAVSMGLIQESQVLDMIIKKPDGIELILTGRGAPTSFVAAADYVTEMINIKHPFDDSIDARKGIEF